jgi:hypothetical protein
MTQAIERANNVRYQPAAIDTERLGDILVKSGYFKDTRDQAQAIVKILAGAEQGFGPIASMMGYDIVEGQPTMSANLIAAAIQKSGLFKFRVREWSVRLCKIEFFEGSESLGVSEFTIEDAARAELAGKTNWKKYPKAMLFARAMSQGARAYTPAVFNGSIYTPDELQEEWEVTTRESIPAPPEGTDVYVPTREREVDDRDLVRSADERIWQNWLRILAEAQGLGLNPVTVTLPIERDELKIRGNQLRDDIRDKQDRLDKEEAARIAARAHEAASARDEDLDAVEMQRQRRLEGLK